MPDQSLILTLIKLNLFCNNYYSSQGPEKVGGSMSPGTRNQARPESFV